MKPETLADVGEFRLIRDLQTILESEGIPTPGLTLGIGDDTASFLPREGYELLVTCDCMVEGQHYLPERITPFSLGRRAMTMNISDIGAMGGTPLYALVSLGLRSETTVAYVQELYRGFLAELNPMEAAIIGGNLTKVSDSIFVNVTLIGEIEQNRLVRRNTARPGDALLVTGYPGESATGLRLLLADETGSLSDEHPLVAAYLTPIHRAYEGKAIASTGLATAMIDTSDGFLGDLGHLCQDSGVGAVLYEGKLPIRDELREGANALNRTPLEQLLGDSDDYELLLTCTPEHVPHIQTAIREVSDVRVTEVGHITDRSDEIQLVDTDGNSRTLDKAGWDHFRSSS